MSDTADLLATLSDRLTALIDKAAPSLAAVAGARRGTVSAIHWRPGVLVTAEEALERDEEIAVLTGEGRRIPATLAGRDPSTDVAVLRFAAEGLPVATVGDAATLRAGQFVLALGRREDGPVAAQGIIGFAAGAWQSARGGTIDRLVRLDLRLPGSAEGGAVLDTAGRVLGMAVPGPRRSVLMIPAATVNRAVDQLLTTGQVSRGYLGAGLRPVRLGTPEGGEPARGVLVISLDPDGPARQAGLLVGDVITGWNGAPVMRLREILRSLGTESVGTTVALDLLRGGAPKRLSVTLGARALR